MIATASSLAKEVRDLATGINRICSDEKSRENKCGNSISKSADRVCTLVRPIYHGSRLWK